MAKRSEPLALPRSGPARSAALLAALGLAAAVSACDPGAETSPPTPAGEDPGPALSKEEIRDIVAVHQEELGACYDRGRAAHSELRGQVILLMTITGEGTVRSAAVQAPDLPPGGADVADCIAAAASTWTFPKHGAEELVVAYPLVLTDDPAAVAARREREAGERSPRERVAGAWYPAPEQPPRSVVVEVYDLSQRPLARRPIALTITGPEGDDRREALTDSEGRAIFADIPPFSEVRAELAPRDAHAAQATIATERVNLGDVALAATLIVGA
ncbi:MAG: AgmX/PglI C-terminal domain-containing protein [Nannocystaceae bacterium]